MIVPRWQRLLFWSAALFSSAASAVGFGEIQLHSRIGEPIRAELPILSAGDQLDVACFSLGNVADADLPVITAGRLRLVRIGQDHRLIISGGKPLAEPIYLISLRAACGIDLQREYLILPAPPLAATQTDYDDGTTLPKPAATPRRARRAPDSEPLDATGEASRPAAKPRRPPTADTPASSANPPPPRTPLANPLTSKDRIILGAAPEALPPGSSDPLAPVNAIEERLLKMETTLHLLNEEVDKLNSALTLKAESRAMRQKLQDMQAQPAGAGFLSAAQAVAPQAQTKHEKGHDGWIELALGVLVGGSLSATIAHLVSRRQGGGSHPFNAPPPHIARPGKARPKT